MPLVHSFSMTRRQIELLEHALRLVAKLSETGWDDPLNCGLICEVYV
jgi:hypothetical protein